MGRLVNPVPTLESEDYGPPPEGVTPPGKACLWINWTGPGGGRGDARIFPTLDEALLMMAPTMRMAGADEAVVNYKSPDGQYLDVWVLRREYHLPKQKPMWESIKDWWQGRQET